MNGPDCPNCGIESHWISTTNEWQYYCPRCNVRFKQLLSKGGVFSFPEEDSGRDVIFESNVAFVAFKSWPDSVQEVGEKRIAVIG